MKQNMIGGRTAWGNRITGGNSQQAASTQAPQASSLAEMLGGNLYARQVTDNSMSPLAMLQQFRATGQIPMNPGSGVMFGQMGQAEQRPSAIGNLPMVAGKPQRTTGGK